MNNQPVMVAIYPNHRGLGYVICKNPQEIIDYGVGYLKRLAPNYYVKRLQKFITRYRPEIIIIKDYGRGLNRVKPRVQKVIDSIEFEAYKQGLQVHRYSREQTQEVFKSHGQTNKFGISLTLARWYPNLEHLLAPRRTLTTPEDYYMGIFDAHALMCTHFALTSTNTNTNHENKNNR